MNRDELVHRLDLIEKMIHESRRNIESWGWIFVLWGVGYILAAGLASLYPTHGGLIWGLTMSTCGVISAGWGIRSRRARVQHTTVGRTIGAIWWSFAVSMFLAGFGLGATQQQAMIPLVMLMMLGLVNFASGLVLKFTTQIVVGVLWWISFVGYLLTSGRVAFGIVIGMVIIGEIFFGIYLMVLERQERRRGATT